MSTKPQATSDGCTVRSLGMSGASRKGGVREGEHVVGMQQRRLLTAIVEVVFERGVQALTVASICERASLSRRTFYEIFEDREECVHATFLDTAAMLARTVELAVAGKERWSEKIRAGLIALLSFLDHEPAIARLLVVEALAAGPGTLDARRRILVQLIAAVDEGRTEAKGGRESPPLAAEGVVGAVFSVIHARMLLKLPIDGAPAAEEEQQPLLELTGPLMAMIVQPYLGGAAARRELERPLTKIENPEPRLPSDPFKDLPIRLTYRTARVLSSIAQAPGSSNKQLAVASGITDEGQISRLLARLQKHDLIQDDGIGPTHGMPRAWTLTQRGHNILQAVGRD